MKGRFYISLEGDDDKDGSAGKPWGTLAGARDALREIRRRGDLRGEALVIVRPGSYSMREIVVLHYWIETRMGTPTGIRRWPDFLKHDRMRLADVPLGSSLQGAVHVPGAIELRWSRKCSVESCTLENIGLLSATTGGL
ncbi:MAG: hypothetical protein JW808_00020 [Victivallales bacterium]|nr:hypothetical protein [Victivallales bacterium]